jgi:uridine kinase
MDGTMNPSFVIGIAGGSGSGKTTLIEKLIAGPYGPYLSLLPQDAYYHGSQSVPIAEDGTCNWDHPDALDNSLYVEHITRLLAGESVARPVYDFAGHHRLPQAVTVEPRPVLLLEGILLLAIPAIRDRIDLRVYMDTPADLRIVRRILRDINERGRTVQSVANQYQLTVRRMHEQYVKPSRYFAHVCIPWLNDNFAAVELLTVRIAAAIHDSQRVNRAAD